VSLECSASLQLAARLVHPVQRHLLAKPPHGGPGGKRTWRNGPDRSGPGWRPCPRAASAAAMPGPGCKAGTDARKSLIDPQPNHLTGPVHSTHRLRGNPREHTSHVLTALAPTGPRGNWDCRPFQLAQVAATPLAVLLILLVACSAACRTTWNHLNPCWRARWPGVLNSAS